MRVQDLVAGGLMLSSKKMSMPRTSGANEVHLYMVRPRNRGLPNDFWRRGEGAAGEGGGGGGMRGEIGGACGGSPSMVLCRLLETEDVCIHMCVCVCACARVCACVCVCVCV